MLRFYLERFAVLWVFPSLDAPRGPACCALDGTHRQSAPLLRGWMVHLWTLFRLLYAWFYDWIPAVRIWPGFFKSATCERIQPQPFSGPGTWRCPSVRELLCVCSECVLTDSNLPFGHTGASYTLVCSSVSYTRTFTFVLRVFFKRH